MWVSRALSAALMVFVGSLAIANSPSARSLKIGGTGAVTEALRQLAPAFKDDSGIDLDVIPGLGTSGANSAVIDGKIAIAVAGRDLREKELAKGLRVGATFRTPFGLVTSRPGPDGLKLNEIAALFGAAKAAWPDGAPVLLILRPADESDNIVMAQLFPGLGRVLPQLRMRRELSVAATDQDNAEAAERNAGSLVGASLVQILAEKRNLRFLAIDGVMPSLEALENGTYPYAKTMFVIVPSEISPEAAAFIAFLAKPEGIAQLRRHAIGVGK